jgi:hypothetical protein
MFVNLSLGWVSWSRSPESGLSTRFFHGRSQPAQATAASVNWRRRLRCLRVSFGSRALLDVASSAAGAGAGSGEGSVCGSRRSPG